MKKSKKGTDKARPCLMAVSNGQLTWTTLIHGPKGKKWNKRKHAKDVRRLVRRELRAMLQMLED